jgi:hypothetical protein
VDTRRDNRRTDTRFNIMAKKREKREKDKYYTCSLSTLIKLKERKRVLL